MLVKYQWRIIINSKSFLRQFLGKSDFIRNIYFRFVKKFDGYIRIYLTLECNLTCRYCVNQCHSKEKLKDDDFVSAKKWITAINRENRDVIFTGGEPTLHPDFIEIVNSINPNIHVKVYTNLIWSDDFTERYISELSRPIKLFVSYHPSGGKPEPFIGRILRLQKAGKFNGIVHSVDYKKQREFIKKARDKFKEAGIELTIDEDQEEVFSEACAQESKNIVECSKKIILISSDGTRYQCVSKLVRGINPLENILEENLKKELVHSTCHEYGYCAPCDMLGDVKIKKL
ncbi:MAG: radical SAM protein [Maribacter sp.]|nr:radical SAM protein [Maribacter sp.]